MLTEIAQIIIAFAVSFILYVTIDVLAGLPKEGGVCGAAAIGEAVEKSGGDIRGGYMLGNIVCSPDASAGTLLAACGVCLFGLWGGLIAAVFVYIGNRICSDKGYAGTAGALVATAVIWGLANAGLIAPQSFIAGMVLAILVIQGISHKYASRLLGKLWRLRA